MKTIYVILLLLCMFFMGCVHATYNPETKAFSYTRIGNQSLSGVIIESGETRFLVETQGSEAEAVIELIKLGVEIGRAEK